MAPQENNKKSRRGRTPRGIRPRRLTRQRAPHQVRVALRLVVRRLLMSNFCFDSQSRKTHSVAAFIIPRGAETASDLFASRMNFRGWRVSRRGSRRRTCTQAFLTCWHGICKLADLKQNSECSCRTAVTVNNAEEGCGMPSFARGAAISCAPAFAWMNTRKSTCT